MSHLPAHKQGRAITYASQLKHLAVSNNYGDIMILDYKDFEKRITTLYRPQAWCEAMAYSPNEEYLAVGSHDSSIYVFQINDKGKYSVYWQIEMVHSSSILGIDWSKDNKYIRAVDQAYAKCYHDIESKELVSEG